MSKKTFIKILGIIIMFSLFLIINITTSEASIIDELQSEFDMTNRNYQFANLKSSTSYVTGITISGPTTVEVGEQIVLYANVTVNGNASTGATWSFGGATGTVQNMGSQSGSTRPSLVLKGVNVGSIVIYATTTGQTSAGGNLKATHVLNIVSSSSGGDDSGNDSGGGDSGGDSGGNSGTQGITVTPTSASIKIGETATFIVSGNNLASTDTFTLTSDNPSIYTVAGSGSIVNITGVSAGTANLKFYLTSDPSIYASATLTVTTNWNPGGDTGDNTGNAAITVTPQNRTINVGDSFVCVPNITNCTDCTFGVNYSQNGIVSVVAESTGGVRITGLSQGTATITFYISSMPTVSTTLYVTVQGSTQPTTVSVTGITLNKTSTTLVQGNTERLTATVTPSNATNKAVNWTSSNSSVAVVDSNGLVSAVSPGIAIITATTVDGNRTANCTVTVQSNQPTTVSVTGVTLNKTTTTLNVGEEETLIETITPSNATNKVVNWTSSNSSVATVNNGIVRAVGVGTAVITVTTVDGNRTATCRVTVTSPDSIVTSDEYIIRENDILRILPETTKGEFLRNITITEGTAVIHPKDSNNEISSGELIKTGMKMDVGNKTYTLIVIGDINGDGKCNLIDLSNLKLHLISVKTLTAENKLAGDMDLDDETDLTDLSIMKRFIVGLYQF